MSNPAAGQQLKRIRMSDPRWAAQEGWVKMQQMIDPGDGQPINVHYVYNTMTESVDDFKIVLSGTR